MKLALIFNLPFVDLYNKELCCKVRCNIDVLLSFSELIVLFCIKICNMISMTIRVRVMFPFEVFILISSLICTLPRDETDYVTCYMSCNLLT